MSVLWLASTSFQGQPESGFDPDVGPNGILMLAYMHIKWGLISKLFVRAFSWYPWIPGTRKLNHISVQVCNRLRDLLFPSALVIKRIGCKYPLLFFQIVYFVGFTLMAVATASKWYWVNVGRAITGFAVGGAGPIGKD